MRSKSEARMVESTSTCGGTPAGRDQRETGKQPMNAIRSEKIESIEEDTNLDAASDLEAGIRDFVRNDIAYRRRRVPSMGGGTDVTEASTDPTVTNVNTVIQRVAGASLAEIESLISE